MKKIIFTFFIIVGSLQSFSQAIPTDQLETEDDWWLPTWVKPTSTSGISFYGEPPALYEGELTELYLFKWKDVNPAEGVYDWSGLEAQLARGVKIIVRMEVSDSIHVPIWLFTKYPDLQSKVFDYAEPYYDNWEVISPSRFIPLWHPGVKAMLDSLLKSFKTNDFASNPNYHSAYYPGAWQWGEYERIDDDILEAQGLTPETYLAWIKGLIDTYVDAYNGNQNKLIFTAGDVLENNSGGNLWRDGVGRQPTEYSIAQGTGARTGMLEKFNFVMTDLPNYGTTVTTIGMKNYMVTDENNLLISDTLRVWANENEEFCYGKNPCNIYHNKMSILKELQLRMNWMYTNETNWNINPELNIYFYLTAGKQVYNSPDAWCALREGKDVYQWWANNPERKDFYISNFERWLYQREVSPEGITERTYLNYDDIDNSNSRMFNDTSYEARKTIHANGADYIYFNVDDKFIKSGINNVQIKITYLDDFAGTWQLQYDGSKSTTQPVTITNSNDNKWKTITLSIPDAKFANSQNSGNDFRLYNGGNNDLTVRFVRVIKLQEPITSIENKLIEGNINIYPNPATNTLFINNLPENSNIKIYDVLGNEVIIQQNSSNSFSISNLQNGIYVLKVENENGVFTKKFIKQ